MDDITTAPATLDESAASTLYVGSVLAGARASAAADDVDDQDCHAAVSPLAYLADLLYYAATHLADANGPLTVAALEARLHQPFGSMGCGDITEAVPQVRVAVEVLRRHLATLRAPGDTSAAEAAYRMAAYEALLAQAGTSFQEVRLATTDEARQALAEQLGLLAADVAAFPVAPADVTEAALESVFGLLDTTRATRPDAPPPSTPLLATARRAALRRDWAEADAAGSAPVVDPDVLRESDFLAPLASNAAYELWTARGGQLRQELAALAAARTGAATALAGFDAMLAHSYGAGAAGALAAIAAEMEAGHTVSAALAPYRLTLDAFRRLWDVRRLAEANAAITAEEWSDADSILARAWKASQAAQWLADETAAGVTRGPDFFVPEPEPALTFPPEPEVALPAWRATAAERRAHLRTLATRMEDDAQVETALAAAVTAAEQAALPALRDALVAATADPAAPAEERTPAARAKWVADHLLIDAQTDGRVATTRLAQATQTLQDLLFAVRTEQLQDSDPDLVLNAPDFDREWAWLGEYGAWRSAMFVFLYPENVLVPSLRRRQSPAFQRLARQLRTNRQLSPDVARTYAEGYAGYLRDVCALSLEAWCTAGAGEKQTPTQFFFARAVPTAAPAERVYWSWRDPAKPPVEQAFWDEVPGLTGVVKLLGARVYEPYGERFVYLFARTREYGQDKLVFTRYNLDTGAWNQSPVVLDDPEDVQESKVVRVWLKLTAPGERPHLGLQPVSGPAYFRGVNDRGTGWQSGDFHSIVQRGTWTKLADIDLSVAGAAARRGAAGDFDGDGRMELAAPQDAQDADGNLFWAVGLGDGGWRHLGGLSGSPVGADGSCTGEAVAAGFTLAGDFDGDGRDELFIAPDWDRSSWTPAPEAEPIATLDGDAKISVDESPKLAAGDETVSTDGAATLIPSEPIDDGDGGPIGPDENYQTSAWVMAWRDGAWRHLTPISDHPFNADLRLKKTGAGELRFGAVGDFDGDGRDELALNDTGNSFYARALRGGRWTGLGGTAGRFSCYTGTSAPSARFATAGDFDGDGRAELAIAASGTGSVRNDFWVMDYDPATGAWGHISPGSEGHPIHADLDCHGDDVPAKYAVAGDFDGDGKDELAVAIDMPGAHANSFWVWKLDTQSGEWSGLGGSVSQYFAHVWCSPGESIPAGFALVGDFDQDGRDELAVCKGTGDGSGNDFWVMDYDPEAGGWRHLVDFDAGALAEAARWGVAGDLDGDGFPEIAVVRSAAGSPGNDGWAWKYQDPEGGRPASVTPVYAGDTTLTERLDRAQLAQLRTVTRDTVLANVPAMRLYFDEAWYAVPVAVGQALQRAGQQTAALDWLQRVYDYATRTRIWYGLEMENGATVDYERPTGWLVDPLDPFAIAATRSQAHTRFTLQALVRCLLEFADAEFTRDTAESLPRARTLYLSALELLGELDAIVPAEGSGAVDLPTSPSLAALVESTRKSVSGAMAIRLPGLRIVGEEATKDAAEAPWIPGLAALSSSSFSVPANPAVQALRTWAEVNLYKLRSGRNIAGVLRDLPPYAAPIDATTGVPTIGSGGGIVLPSTGSPQPTPYRYALLIQRARQLAAQAQQVESMMLSALEKLDAEAYTAYRAQLDARVAEAQVVTMQYRVQQAQGGVTLAELQLGRAAIQESYYADLVDGGLSGWETATLWLTGIAATLQAAAAVESFIAAGTVGPGTNSVSDIHSKISGGLSSLAGATSTTASLLSTIGSFERRQAEWEFQLRLARQEILIGTQQVDMAKTEVRVATQEQKTAELQSRNATAVVDFLARKFTGVELYEWMSGILQGVYAAMLQQATAMARLAERQLAFERQESVQNRIAADYWSAPGEGGIAGQTAPERSGLTGSARLAADLEALDQHAFESDRRRLQLSRTLSLLRLDPARFQLFRETGVMVFETPTELFDRDFPGHYMRVIRRVRTSVVALVPPSQGIRAELMNISASTVTVPNGAGGMTQASLGAAGQTVALTAPMNASGVFELDAQPDMLAPFEGLGVDLRWMFRMPKASNPIDYSTIADVLVTVEYTALDDPTWREVRIRQLGTEATGDRAFSFRQEYADQWFDLNNPPSSGNTSTVRFTTVRGDFPANLSELGVEEIALFFAGENGPAALPANFDVELYRTVPDAAAPGGVRRVAGGTARVVGGRVDTRAASGLNWRSIRAVEPAGGWELAIPNDEATRTLFQTEAIADLVLVLTWSGETPAWV